MRVSDYKTGSNATAIYNRDFGHLHNSWTLAEQRQLLVSLTEGEREKEELRRRGRRKKSQVLLEFEGGFQRGRRIGQKGVSCTRSRWQTLEEEWSSTSSMRRGSGTIREQVRFHISLKSLNSQNLSSKIFFLRPCIFNLCWEVEGDFFGGAQRGGNNSSTQTLLCSSHTSLIILWWCISVCSEWC